MGRDPQEEKGGLHLYGFVGNNGINRWDYLGMDPSLAYGGNSSSPPLQLGQDPSLVAQNAQTAAWYNSMYGRYNSGTGMDAGAGLINNGLYNPDNDNVWAVDDPMPSQQNR